MEKLLITIGLVFTCLLTAKGQDKFPMYDTTHGVVVYYTNLLEVKADSAYLILRADQTQCDAFNIFDCGFYGGAYYKPHWYEWRVILKNGLAIPVKHKIFFNQVKKPIAWKRKS